MGSIADQDPQLAHVGVTGAPGTRLLAGPAGEQGAESLEAHRGRLGPCPDIGTDRAGFLDALRLSGLRGRGGGGFPAAGKLAAAAAGQGKPLVVVNASESEPASRKDATLVELRPHLILDGAHVLASAAAAEEVCLVLHRGNDRGRRALALALTERAQAGLKDPAMTLVLGPDRYVSGEASAVVSLLEGGPAKPRFNRGPAAVSGVHGRPTLIYNAETTAHVGLLARHGPEWFHAAGSPGRPGSSLVTLAGAVSAPGRVIEVLHPVTMGELLCAGGLNRPPEAVLVGGYAGTWLDGATAWDLPFSSEALGVAGASIGCGVLGVLPVDACGVIETARLVTYLAGESAGQCGPCVFGLEALAEALEQLAVGQASRAELRRLHRRAVGIVGRGACRHPDGVVGLVQSALRTFAPEVRRHLRGYACAGAEHDPVFPIPPTGPGWR
ncbi:MAG: NADH-ubiquinone oxidoreductase-F iron-sulfur binding region domain-containing protein [Acidimicrobiales bacterium]